MSLKKDQLSEEQKTALELIEAACKLMGWGVILPFENDEVHYIIIGTHDGIDSALARLNGEMN